MNYRTFLATILALSATGCAVQPLSFDESLHTKAAMRNDVADWDQELKYRVSFQYANAARQVLSAPQVDIPPDTTLDMQVPFAIWDISRGASGSGALAFADWFNSGLSEDARYAHYYNEELAYLITPNTHYFTFDQSPGSPTDEDIQRIWDEASSLFEAVHNRSGRCYVFGYDKERQYASTYSKNVPGKYKVVGYRCPNVAFPDQEMIVAVSAWAKPFPGVKALGIVQMQCYVRPPRGERFVDTRACSTPFANDNRARLPVTRSGWLELISTVDTSRPEMMKIVAVQDDESRTLPPPELTPEYQEYLRSIP